MPNKGSLILFARALILALGFLATADAAFAASKEKVLYSFCALKPCPDGNNPGAGLISDAAGSLYGTAGFGGIAGCGFYGCGVVFKLTPRKNGGWTESVLHTFSGKDGENPAATLVFDAAGNLYGTTYEGGDLSGCGRFGCGVVFKLVQEANGKWNAKVLHIFHGADGAGPWAGVILDAAGNLYGTTSNGGDPSCTYPQTGCGVVFKLSPGADGKWIETVLHRFTPDDRYSPSGGLIFDAAGNLYGTTTYGATNGSGSVFKLTPTARGNWTETLIHIFGFGDGASPEAGLIFDAAGNLYGTTFDGGCGNYAWGTVFQLTPNVNDKWTETILHTFNLKDGYGPTAGVVFDTGGNLYGTTAYGGDSFGTIFKLAPNANGKWTETVLHKFQDNDKDGVFPFAGLVFGPSGNLYGVAEGGTYGYGAFFEIAP